MCALTWQWMIDELQQLEQKSQYRQLVDTRDGKAGWLLRDGRSMLNLASNHYLGLYQRFTPDIYEPLIDELQVDTDFLRMGSTASRLIVGNDPVFQHFEREFALYKGTESCLLFSNGYMANVGVISSLMRRGDYVFSDRLNHASITDGIILSRAEHQRYHHRDIEQLEHLLRKAPRESKKLIVTDALFSMDGTLAPLEDLVALKNKYQAMLFVDEAHSGGVYGTEGEGLVHALGLTKEVDIHMGTFSKAYGCYGAYVASSQLVVQYLINKARSFIYTTALPPIVVLMIYYNWLQVRKAKQQRAHLIEQATLFRSALQTKGLFIGDSESYVIPLMIGSNELTIQFAERLQQVGIAAVPIRPPTVREGTARIRFTLTAAHQESDLFWALEHIVHIARDLGLVKG